MNIDQTTGAASGPAPTPLQPEVSQPVWLGMLGGGQLGRMFVQAAHALGYRVMVLDPDPDCPASAMADQFVCADYADTRALALLGERCQAVSTEFENVPAAALQQLARSCRVAPAAECVAIAQDRSAEKRFFDSHTQQFGVRPTPYLELTSESGIDGIPDYFLPGVLKTARMGYDGKGQIRVANRDALLQAFRQLGSVPCVLEQWLPLASEISVLVVRGANGEQVAYPAAENCHRHGILHTSTIPAQSVAPKVAKQAQQAALAISNELGYVGVLCIEFFVLQDGSLLVNEMAPRPHNSAHYTLDASHSSQFEQQVRALAGLPLGSATQLAPAIMLNLLGDLWFDGQSDVPREPAWQDILALPAAKLHLYGKQQARRGRKMGHITFVAPTLEQAQAQLQQACEVLGIEP